MCLNKIYGLQFFFREEFHVTAKPNTSNVAYLSGHLQMHTDLPYYEYTPGVRCNNKKIISVLYK